MHSESSDEEDNNMLVFHKKDQKRMVLQKTSQKFAQHNAKNSLISCLINNHLDQHNKAESQICSVDVVHNVKFENYFTKNKNKKEKQKVFDQLRNLLIERGYNQISQISDREEIQIMVVRVVSKIQNALNTVIIQDQSTKDKLVIKQGILWVGMICAIKAKWYQGSYKLQSIIDLSTPIPQLKAHLSANMSVNRVMFVKGPFRPKYTNQDEGIRTIIYELKKLKKNGIMINQLIVMGPILSKNNNLVQNFCLEKTFQEQYEEILTNLRNQINQVSSDILIYVMPALQDVISLHPLPQPAYVTQNRKTKIKYLSNPSSLNIQGRRSTCKIDLINYDILKYIDSHKAGKNLKQLRQQNMQTYIKQPFFMSNSTTSQDPFDQVNLCQLYNHGDFGNLIVFSSIQNPPFINEVNGRIILNIGSLGVETNFTGKNYLAIASIYEGEGPVNQRIKIEVISSG